VVAFSDSTILIDFDGNPSNWIEKNLAISKPEEITLASLPMTMDLQQVVFTTRLLAIISSVDDVRPA
jgi:hypothetical protein